MKKNIAMRVAAILFILTMISTCAFSTTFAKYVTSDKAEDSARVAKWGVVVDVTGDDAFGEKYDNQISSTGTKVVSAISGKNVLAPGTNGDLGSVKITGSPEVKVSVSVDLKLTVEGWEIDGEFYCPISISDGTTTVSGLDYTKAEDFVAAVEGLVDSVEEKEANATLDGLYDVILTWSWAFEGASGSKQTDVKDTALGKLAIAPTIEAVWSASVTQID